VFTNTWPTVIRFADVLHRARNNHLLWRLRKSSEQRPRSQDRFHRRGSKSLSVRQRRRNEQGTGWRCSVNKPTTETVKMYIGHSIYYGDGDRNRQAIRFYRREPDTYDLVEYPVSHGERSSVGDEVEKELSRRDWWSGEKFSPQLAWPRERVDRIFKMKMGERLKEQMFFAEQECDGSVTIGTNHDPMKLLRRSDRVGRAVCSSSFCSMTAPWSSSEGEGGHPMRILRRQQLLITIPISGEIWIL